MDVRLSPGAKVPDIGDVLAWGGDGWEPQSLNARPHRVLHYHTDRIVQVAMGPTQSHNFVSGSTGWRIKEDGSAEFNDVTVRGTIYASAGEIGGWTIQSAYLAKDTGTDATSAGMAPADYPFYAGATYANRASAPFRVTPAGALVASNATITGSIDATSGTIGGWSITATQIKSDSGTIVLDKTGIITVAGVGYLTSSPFSSGVQGWRITPTEAEFENIVARGEIRTAVFTYNEVHALAGQLLVTPNAAKMDADLTIAASGSFDVGTAGMFGVNDVVRLKDGTADVWLTVTADNADGTYNYTRSSGAAAGTVFRAGTAVVGYGASGEGGVLLDAVSANGPFIDVFTQAGSPWTGLTTKVRVGNLAGITDADLNPSGYGMYCDNVFLKGSLVAGGGNVEVVTEGLNIEFNPTGTSAGRIKFFDFDGAHDGYVIQYAYANDVPITNAIWYVVDVIADDSTGSDTNALASISAIGKGQGGVGTGAGTGLMLRSWETPVATYVGAVLRADETIAQLDSQDGNTYARFECHPDGNALFLGRNSGGWVFQWKDYDTGAVVAQVDSDGDVSAAGELQVGRGLWVGSTGSAPDDNDLHIDGSINKSTALGCLVYRNATQTITHNTTTALSFTTQVHDTDGCWPGGANTRLKGLHAGYYIAGASVRWDATAAGARRMALVACMNDGSNRNLARNDLHSDENAVAGMSVTTGMFYLDGSNDYVYFNVYQDSGGNMTIRAASTTNLHECNAWLVRVA